MEQEAIDSTLEVCFNSNYFCKLIKKVYYENKDNHEDFKNKVLELAKIQKNVVLLIN